MFLVQKFYDVEDFKRVMIPYLEKEEAVNGLPLGILMNIDEKIKPTVMAGVYKDEQPILMLLQTHPKQIIVSVFQKIIPLELSLISKLIHESITEIPGFIGEKTIVREMAQHIASLRQLKVILGMDQRIYQLNEVKKKPSNLGNFRWITKNDQSTIQQWVYDFAASINQPLEMEQAIKRVEELIQGGKLAGWEVDHQLVSMANASRPTKNNITINFVYTPKEFRNKGYATNCVAELSERLLESDFSSTSLYTDITNPTSNKIYMEIGYQPMIDSILLFLEK
ncbi:GNAT family N-acetyltransferase [Niallia sp. FSL W8-1348]|uniref:GNAT family N-acetyltransferase n=1 Tax=Niallia sp. FSL W8-1348 TaxID=2954656 RepID=UPI0030F5247D